MKKYIIKLLIVFVLFNYYLGVSHADLIDEEVELNSAYDIAKDKEKTIKELTKNISELNTESENLKNNLELLKRNSSLGDFFRDNLTQEEINQISEIYNLYKIYEGRLDKKFLDEAKDLEETTLIRYKLLGEKRDFYKKLTPYIKEDRINDYLEYTKGDKGLTKEKNELNSEIISKEVILQDKVETIQEKIINHKKKLDEKIDKIVEIKTSEKINHILYNEKYSNITSEGKKEIFEKTINKFEDEIYFIKNSDLKNNYTTKKIRIFEVIIDKLEEVALEL